jgi:hypothetical protein
VAALRDGTYHAPAWFAVLAAASMMATYVATMLLASLGIANSRWTHWQTHLLSLLMVLWICGLHSVVFGHSRYHFPLMPILIVYAVAACRQASWRLGAAPAWRRAVALALVAMCLAIWTHELLIRDFGQIRQLVSGKT